MTKNTKLLYNFIVYFKIMNSETDPRQWKDLIDESVHTSDDIDIGDIEAVSKSFVVVKRGFINIHYYYIPMIRIEGWGWECIVVKRF